MNNIPEKARWPGWETVRLIGRGSFGAVYEIQRSFFDTTEKAALKVISIPQNSGEIDDLYSDGYDEESITNTFQDHLKSIVSEYSLMRKLNGCSNVVNCDDMRYIQQENGYGWDIYIKMELLSPLTKVLPGDIPEETVIRAAKDLCAALNICKRHNIIHRDIKPQNIFLSENGDYKLGDFGIAKTVEKTSGGTRIGTYKYIAPEVFYNKPYGSSADIYSLGLTLYWMLNRRRMPFLPLPPAKLTVGMEEEARTRRLRGQPVPPPWDGSDRLKAIVLKACAFDPADRYQSAKEMLDDLNELDAQKPGKLHAISVEVSEPDCEGTTLLDQAEETALLLREEASEQKPYGFVEETMLLEEDDTCLMPLEGEERNPYSMDSEGTSLLNENVEERSQMQSGRSAVQKVNNTGFTSANEMLDALGLHSLKSNPIKVNSSEKTLGGYSKNSNPEEKREKEQKSERYNTGFHSADEMLAALGRSTKQQPDRINEKHQVQTKHTNNGFSSARDMLEFLGVDFVNHMKK